VWQHFKLLPKKNSRARNFYNDLNWLLQRSMRILYQLKLVAADAPPLPRQDEIPPPRRYRSAGGCYVDERYQALIQPTD
jgi:hypothetical protein